MNHQPLITDPFKKIGREHAGFNRLVVLPAGEVLGTDHPAQVACNLDLHVGQFEFHGEGVIEDEHPGIAHCGPVASEGPAWVNSGNVLEMRPHFVHLEHIQAFKGGVKR